MAGAPISSFHKFISPRGPEQRKPNLDTLIFTSRHWMLALRANSESGYYGGTNQRI